MASKTERNQPRAKEYEAPSHVHTPKARKGGVKLELKYQSEGLELSGEDGLTVKGAKARKTKDEDPSVNANRVSLWVKRSTSCWRFAEGQLRRKRQS